MVGCGSDEDFVCESFPSAPDFFIIPVPEESPRRRSLPVVIPPMQSPCFMHLFDVSGMEESSEDDISREEDEVYSVDGDQVRESARMRDEDRVVEQDWLHVGSRIGNEEGEVTSRPIHQDAIIEVRDETSVREDDSVPVKPEFREEIFPEEACQRNEAVLFREDAAYGLLDNRGVSLCTDEMIDLVSESSSHVEAGDDGLLSAQSPRGPDRLVKTPQPVSDDASVLGQPCVYSPSVALSHMWHSTPLFPPQISISDGPCRQTKSDITIGNGFEVAEDDTEFVGRVLFPCSNGQDIITPGGGRLNFTPDFQRLHSLGSYFIWGC